MSDDGWEKILWKDQRYPDNYIPERYFLSSLRKNPNFRPYTYWQLVLASLAISQHLSSIFIFLAVFVWLKEGALDARILVWLSIGCFVGGYIVWEGLEWSNFDRAQRNANRSKTVKSSILVFLALIALSPVLRTLSAATSSDSIWALSAGLFVLNALLADYSPGRLGDYVRGRLTSVLSMNAAISSSVVLASRLADDLAVFALILFAVQAFTMFPILRQRLQASPPPLTVLLTVVLSTSCLNLTMPLSITVTCLYAITFIFVTFLAPAVLVWAQKYKNEIRGPWDVAVPKVN